MTAASYPEVRVTSRADRRRTHAVARRYRLARGV